VRTLAQLCDRHGEKEELTNVGRTGAVLKIVALEATGFTERRNLRAGKSNLNFSTNDIRWHPRTCRPDGGAGSGVVLGLMSFFLS
jgi:hypothetical protein